MFFKILVPGLLMVCRIVTGLEILLDDRRFRGLNGGAQDVENGNEASGKAFTLG